jgi:hypothetical protein
MTGVEPVTSSFAEKRSVRLSYIDVKMVAEEGFAPSRSCEHLFLRQACLLFHHSAVNGDLDGIRTRVTGVRGRRPGC